MHYILLLKVCTIIIMLQYIQYIGKSNVKMLRSAKVQTDNKLSCVHGLKLGGIVHTVEQ